MATRRGKPRVKGGEILGHVAEQKGALLYQI